MKNSQKFKSKLNRCRITCILFILFLIYLIIKNLILELGPYFKIEILIIICIFLISSILILIIYYMNFLNKLAKLGKEKIYKELDNNIQKKFEEFGLYITKNYIVCLGSRFDLFRLFVVPISSIDAIDTCKDSRYYYDKKGKHGILWFLKASIKDDFMYGNNSNISVFNLICDKKVYSIATSSAFNKRKLKKIEEAAGYICDKYENIDWI